MSLPTGHRRKLPGGHELHYLESGTGAPVVFVHGSGPGASAYSNFKHNYQVLAAAGYRALLPDLIGFGQSSKPAGIDYTLDLFAATLLELLNSLGLERFTLIGNSLGGAVSMKIAIDHPQRVEKLVLMGPGGLESREAYFKMPGIQRMVSGFVGEGFDRAGLHRLLAQSIVYDPAMVTEELVAERLEVLATQPKEVLSRMIIPDLSPELARIQCPVLGFWGIEDQFCPASGFEKILRACPDSRFVMFSRCGHWAMMERMTEFNTHVLEFLRT